MVGMAAGNQSLAFEVLFVDSCSAVAGIDSDHSVAFAVVGEESQSFDVSVLEVMSR